MESIENIKETLKAYGFSQKTINNIPEEEILKKGAEWYANKLVDEFIEKEENQFLDWNNENTLNNILNQIGFDDEELAKDLIISSSNGCQYPEWWLRRIFFLRRTKKDRSGASSEQIAWFKSLPKRKWIQQPQ